MNGAAEQSSSQRTTTILRRRCFVVVVVVVVVTAGAVAGRLRRHASSRGATVYTAAQDKGKGSPYSTAERRLPELTRFLAVSLQVL